jgi:hypothetical protein
VLPITIRANTSDIDLILEDNVRVVVDLTNSTLSETTTSMTVPVKIYIDGFAAVKETLSEEYTDMTAQLGMDCWTPNETPIEIPFSISVAIAE